MSNRLYINPTLEKAIRSYCELNEIEDINAFANRCAMQGFNIVKYGTSPKDNVERENKGIKDIDKNESKPKKKESSREDKGKQDEQSKQTSGERLEEESKPTQERKENNVVVRKIQVIKKQ